MSNDGDITMQRTGHYRISKFQAMGYSWWILSLMLPLGFAAFAWVFLPGEPLFPPLSLGVTGVLLLACAAGLLRSGGIEVDAEKNRLSHGGRRYLLSDVALVRVVPREGSSDELIKKYVIEVRVRGTPTKLFTSRPISDSRKGRMGAIAAAINDAIYIRSQLDGARPSDARSEHEGPYRQPPRERESQ